MFLRGIVVIIVTNTIVVHVNVTAGILVVLC